MPFFHAGRKKKYLLGTTADQPPFFQLPDEVIILIFAFLSPANLLLMAQTCRYFRALSADKQLWQKHLERHGIKINEKELMKAKKSPAFFYRLFKNNIHPINQYSSKNAAAILNDQYTLRSCIEQITKLGVINKIGWFNNCKDKKTALSEYANNLYKLLFNKSNLQSVNILHKKKLNFVIEIIGTEELKLLASHQSLKGLIIFSGSIEEVQETLDDFYHKREKMRLSKALHPIVFAFTPENLNLSKILAEGANQDHLNNFLRDIVERVALMQSHLLQLQKEEKKLEKPSHVCKVM